MSKATDQQEQQYADLLNRDPQIQAILRQLKALPGGLSQSVFGAPDSPAKVLQAQYQARIQELGINTKEWSPTINWNGATPTISVDHQNFVERHPDAFGALAVGALDAAFLLPALAGGAGGGGAGSGGASGGYTIPAQQVVKAGIGAGTGFGLNKALGYILEGAGTALDVISQIRQGNAEKKLNLYNAGVADALAQDALDRGAQDEANFRASIRGIIGKQRAGFAGQGIDVGQGSAVDVQADAAYLGELDAQKIKANAKREAFGYQTQAEEYRLAGDNAQVAGILGGLTTALGSTTSMLQQRWGMK